MNWVETELPSFSIVLETENLANADFNGLVRSIESLARQDLSPTCANEVLLLDSGDTPQDLLAQLCKQYFWIQVYQTSVGTDYYQSKMQGAKLATGEIVVYYDSDCIYEPTWLRTILSSFVQNGEATTNQFKIQNRLTDFGVRSSAEAYSKSAQSNEAHERPKSKIQIVAGETTTRGVGLYETAMALTYIFPQFSGQKTLTPSSQYFLNNVAFRRSFLLEHPIPTQLPLYRGNCVIHAHELCEKGYTIWRQPQARATHAPPNGLSHFFWRFLLIGHDYYWQKQILGTQTQDPTLSGMKGKMQVFYDRVSKLFKNDPRHAIFFPLAIPITIVAAILIYIGYEITSRKPNYLLNTYSKILSD